MRKIKRTREFEVVLNINDEDFVRPPQDYQRNVIFNQVMKELVSDLKAWHETASKFVSGDHGSAILDRTDLDLDDENIMEDWQVPIMKEMAKVVCESGGSILEVGFGRGIASTFIQEQGASAHTILECNDSVIERFNEWKLNFPNQKIDIVRGLWQDTINSLDQFDGIFFHTYALNQDEYTEYVTKSITFAEHFFPHAAGKLREGGIFTYFTNEIDSLSREHQRLIFKYFSSFSVHVVPLKLPDPVKDAWYADSMVIVKAVK